MTKHAFAHPSALRFALRPTITRATVKTRMIAATIIDFIKHLFNPCHSVDDSRFSHATKVTTLEISGRVHLRQHSNQNVRGVISTCPIQADGVKIPTMVTHGIHSRWVAPLWSLLTGFGFFFLGSLSDVWLRQHVASLWIAVVDDALIGVGAGLLVLLYERRQRQNIIRKLEVIRLMNHHVRNSLQVISFAASIPQQEELGKNLRDAVERIEWALREVLPGQRENISDLPLHSYPKESSSNKVVT